MTSQRSRLLTGIKTAIDADPRSSQADCLRAEYAGQLARHGKLKDAGLVLSNLRRQYATAHPKVTPWINFAESMIERASGNEIVALNKMRRAYALSKAAGLNELHSASAATLGHIYWNREDVATAIDFICEALAVAGADDHTARCRSNLVVAEIMAMSGRDDLAQPWFARARHHASTAGDDASLAALSFNLATTRLMRLRQAILSKRLDKSSSSAAVASHFDASSNADQLMEIALDALTLVQRACLCSLEGKSLEALLIYRSIRNNCFVSKERVAADSASDEAWCHARLGNFTEARVLADAAESLIVPATQLDDLSSTRSRLSLVYKALGDERKSRNNAEVAWKLWEKYEQFQKFCLTTCQRVSPTG